jgi:hypothetical protein
MEMLLARRRKTCKESSVRYPRPAPGSRRQLRFSAPSAMMAAFAHDASAQRFQSSAARDPHRSGRISDLQQIETSLHRHQHEGRREADFRLRVGRSTDVPTHVDNQRGVHWI